MGELMQAQGEETEKEKHVHSEQECPSCGATLPVIHGYVTWCERCEWNLKPQEPLEKKSRFGQLYDSMYEKIGARSSRKLYEQVVKKASVKPTFKPSVALALAIALVVHAITFGVMALGVYLIVALWPHWSGIVYGLICFGIAWTLRPRLPKRPKKIISREKYPVLYKLVDEISAELGTSTVEGIVISSKFNAMFQQYGWRRKKVLTIGMPLFLILTGQEKVAILGHEIAHGANGDPNRGLILGHAIRSLVDWHYFLYPVRILDGSRRAMRAGVAMILPNLLFRLICLGIQLVIYVLAHLSWHESQWAEYYADSLAAEASGTDAMMSLLEKLHYGDSFWFIVQKVYLSKGKMRFAEAFQEKIATMPERELQRIRRVEKMEQSRLDTTHPPTSYRIGFMEARHVETPRYLLSKVDEEQLEKELQPLYAELEGRLMENYKWSLYR
jgi:Zn-dependent protease with chaperone function